MTAQQTIVARWLWLCGAWGLAACAADADIYSRSAGPAQARAGTGATRVMDSASGAETRPPLIASGVDQIENACAGVSATAQATGLRPTDVVWAIDTSGSMFAAIVPIQQALDAFSRRVIEAGVDTRVILLSGAELCVAPPLGSGQCAAPSGGNMAGMSGMPMRNVSPPLGKPAADSREPVFLHLDTPFGADQGMVVLLDNYPGYKHLLRGNARTQLLITEDGVSPYATQAVIDHVEGRASATTMPAWMPGLSAKSWTFNGIVCQKGWGLGTCVAALQPPASTLELIDATGGLVADLMNVGVAGSDPFAQLLDKLAENVIVGAQVSCDYKIPAPPSGMSFDPEQVNVVYTDGDANEVTFPRTANMSPCDQHEAWHYDVPEAPESVRLCPAACERVQRDPAARVDVKFGCNTTVLSPS